MESKANYTLVGLFVVLFGTAMIVFILWLGKYGGQEDEQDLYKVYIRDSVSGLEKESPVKFRGVHVGSVQLIKINPDNSEEIEVLLEIEQGTPIKEDSYVELGSQGLTGLSYIELKGGSNLSPKLITSKKNPALIESRESFFTTLKSSATEVTGKLDQTLARVNLLLSERNIHNIEKILSNIDQFTTSLNQKIIKFDALVESTIQAEQKGIETLEEIDSLSVELRNTARNFSRAGEEIKTASANANELIEEVKVTFKRGDYNLKAISQESVDHLNDVLSETKTMILSAKEAIESIKESPSDLLFKSQQPRRGPGEEYQ